VATACHGDQSDVELPVCLGLLECRSACGRLPHRVEPAAQVLQCQWVGYRRCHLHGQSFQHFSETEQLFDVPWRELCHPHTAPRQVLYQALLAQQAQCLAQRCSAGTETPGELFFDQPLAGNQRAAQDFGAQAVRRELDQT
jgi:hypothetical protein